MNDITLCILVEDVDTAGVEGYLDGVACARGGARGNASDQLSLLTDLQVQIDFRTHQLGYVNVGINNGVMRKMWVRPFDKV